MTALPCQLHEHAWFSLAPGTGRGWLAAWATGGWRFAGDPDAPEPAAGNHGNLSIGMVREVRG